MRLILERASLLAALASCKSTVEARNVIPILACVRLMTESGRLEIAGSDMDILTVDVAAAEIETHGALCVNQAEFYDLVRRLPDGAEITLEHTGAKLTIRAGRTRATLATMAPDPFPYQPREAFEHSFTLEVGALARLFNDTQFAMSNEETRYYLNGIFLHLSRIGPGRHLAAAATDGHRMAWSHADIPEGAEAMPGVIISRKTIGVLLPLLTKRAEKNATEPVRIGVSASKIGIEIGNIRLVSKLVDGDFPDYRRIIPTDQSTFAKMPRRLLQIASERAAAILDGKSKVVRLAFSGAQQDGLTLTSASEAADIEDKLDVILEGPAETVAVNGHYLAEGLASFSCDDITLSIKAADIPLLLSDDRDDRRGVVIMPMRG